jgi:hypothetical protein
MDKNDLHPLAIKLRQVLSDGLTTQTQIASACKVSIQAITGWKNTGRIAKEHLPVLATLTGKSIEWWMTGLERQRPKKITTYDLETEEFAAAFFAMEPEERATYKAILQIASKPLRNATSK